MGREPQAVLDQCGECFAAAGLTVNDMDPQLRVLKVTHPVQQQGLVGVGGETADGEDLRADHDLFPVDLDRPLPVNDAATQGARRLKADDDQRRAGAPQVVFQVVLDTTSGAHATAGDDDRGPGLLVDCNGFLRGSAQDQLGKGKGIDAVPHHLGRRLIVFIPPSPENLGGVYRQRTIEIDGHGGNPAIAEAFPDHVEQFLGPFHGEGRNDHLLTGSIAVVDGFDELILARFEGFVVAITVSRLDKQRVGRQDRLRIFENQLIFASQISRKDHLVSCGLRTAPDFQDGRPQDVAGIAEAHPQVVFNGNRFVFRNDFEKRKTGLGIGDGIERH